jgi:3-methyl-2-oxobutanoate hydroxymethyltransferase
VNFDYLKQMKREGRRIVMCTAYDAPFAEIMSRSGAVDLLLVGDSLAMVVQGKESTREVTLEQMAYHTEMAARGAERGSSRSIETAEARGLEPQPEPEGEAEGAGAGDTGGAGSADDHPERLPIIGDLPFGTYAEPAQALTSARRLIEAGADAVKIEGGDTAVVKALAEAGIPVMGHLGLLPQTAERFTVQGKEEQAARRMQEEARALQDAGAFSLVLECIPRKLARRIREQLAIPTIGIGAGPACDGQVLVLHDMLGLTEGYLPRFVKRYASLGSTAEEGIRSYARDVRSGAFPEDSHSYH